MEVENGSDTGEKERTASEEVASVRLREVERVKCVCACVCMWRTRETERHTESECVFVCVCVCVCVRATLACLRLGLRVGCDVS